MILIGKKPIEFTTYPNGETVINEQSIKEACKDASAQIGLPHPAVLLKYESDVDLLRLMMIRPYIPKNWDLRILYMPYSRMDRHQAPYGFSLKTVCEFINNLNFRGVQVLEPHSHVTCALLDNAVATYPVVDFLLPDVVEMIGFDKDHDQILLPDAGAQTRYPDLAGYHPAYGNKHRRFDTGALVGFRIAGLDRPRKVIIIDDLCSRGGTFVLAIQEANKVLEDYGVEPPEWHLVTAHTENTVFQGELFGYITGLWTTDSIITDPNFEMIHIYSLLTRGWTS